MGEAAGMGIFSPDETKIIRDHRMDTLCYVATDTDPCAKLADGRVADVTGRRLECVSLDELPARRPKSWLAAIIHCGGDDLSPVASWARSLTLPDLDRVVFFEPGSSPEAEALASFGPWLDAGLPDPIRHRFTDFRELNRLLGTEINLRIWEDHRPASWF